MAENKTSATSQASRSQTKQHNDVPLLFRGRETVSMPPPYTTSLTLTLSSTHPRHRGRPHENPSFFAEQDFRTCSPTALCKETPLDSLFMPEEIVTINSTHGWLLNEEQTARVSRRWQSPGRQSVIISAIPANFTTILATPPPTTPHLNQRHLSPLSPRAPGALVESLALGRPDALAILLFAYR
ncbi:hypothetical protein J6590_044218 [Homalodisca vitripennis]|nr:hypothetical protein J6590_044218 [Homalodisca vitripennis]